MSDDYFARCYEARQLGDMRRRRERDRMARLGITDEDKEKAGEEIRALWVNFQAQPPGEQLRRRNLMMACARVRGYLHDPDPAYDLWWLDSMRLAVEALVETLTTED